MNTRADALRAQILELVAEYHADMGVINQDGDKIYRYMNFDKIEEYEDVARAISKSPPDCRSAKWRTPPTSPAIEGPTCSPERTSHTRTVPSSLPLTTTGTPSSSAMATQVTWFV